MDEAKMSDAKANDADLWLMDDTYPYSLSDLKDFPLSKEMEEKVEAIVTEILGPKDEVQPAA